MSGLPSWAMASAARRLHAEENIFHYGEVAGEGKLLVDHGNTAAAGVEGIAGNIGDPVDPHLPGIGSVCAREDLHEGALAGAVFTDEREDLTGIDA
jgi:hypothetical protein